MMCKCCGAMIRAYLPVEKFRSLEADTSARAGDYIMEACEVAWKYIDDKDNWFITHLTGATEDAAACMHKRLRLCLPEAAICGGPMPMVRAPRQDPRQGIPAGLMSSTFNPVDSVASDLVLLIKSGTDYVTTRWPCPGANGVPTKEGLIHTFGNMQALVDRTRDALNQYGEPDLYEKCVVKGPDGVSYQIESRWAYAVYAGYVRWDMNKGLSSGDFGRYSDPECRVRLFDWAPTMEEWYKNYFGALPTAQCPRPDLAWPNGLVRPPGIFDREATGALGGLALEEDREVARHLDPSLYPQWTPEEVLETLAYRKDHPLPEGDYQNWPVTVVLLQQPYVLMTDEKEISEYKQGLDDREKSLKSRPYGDTMKDMDGQRFDRLILDDHRKQAEEKRRPAKRSDAAFDPVLEQVVVKLRTCWIVYCVRQIIDGVNGVTGVIEAWLYQPGFGYVRWLWEYRGVIENGQRLGP